MATFITPYSGTAELTAGNGLDITSQGLWVFNKFNLEDAATFYLSLSYPSSAYGGEFSYGAPPAPTSPVSGGELNLSATDWTIANIGNELTSYTDPDTSITYPASKCRIQITGRWEVVRKQNSNSYNSFGVIYSGHTHTDLGDRDIGPYILTYVTLPATYVIQGSGVEGGPQDTFSDHEFYCRLTELATTDNSNYEFQSNTTSRPVWAYNYSKSWQTD